MSSTGIITKNIEMKTVFDNANEAYEYFLDKIILDGVSFDDTKALFNVGFTILNPEKNIIKNKERNWKIDYACLLYTSPSPRDRG